MKTLVSVLCVLVAAGGSAAGRVLSVNIAYGDADKMSVQDGLDNSLAGDNIPCSSWHDVSAVSGSVTGLPVWTGTNVETVATLALSWDVKEIWGTGSSPCVFRRGWIAATSKGEWTMTFSNVPFASYDVICYCNWDGGHGFEPIQVNGQKWTQGGSDAVVGTAYWGTVTTDLNDSAKFGQNAIRVAGQSGSTLEIGSRGYGNVCAVQIVEKSAGGEDPPVVDPPAVDPNAPALPDGLVMTKYDRNGRSWWLQLDPSRAANVTQWQVTYPNPDDESGITNETATLAHSTSFPNATFRRRFPAGEGPWTVTVSVTMSGTVYAGSLTVRRPTETVAPPVRNGEILVGVVAYESQVGSDGSASFLQNSADLLYDVLENDLCNFCISWYGIEMLMPQSWPSSRREIWKRRIEDSSFSAMSIYSGDYRSTQARAMRAFDGRYWGNNVGELASFLYQGVREMQANLNLQQARDTFVNGFVGNKVVLGTREGGYDFDMTFSTCGAALSCYELAGGIDFICSELWAIGAANIGYASAEARGAARKWGPEYWGGWNAHDWQTRNIPYHTDQKFNSMLASYFQEYIAGTSMIILESGTQGPQAWQYAEMYPGQPYAERAPEGYDGEVATRYRRMVKRFYEWTKTHPRGDATPESKIALALGNLDGYLGENGGYAVWAQHDNTGNANWRYGAPENTQALVQDIFYPRPESLTAPYKNSWIGGTPYGQADVMQIDDDVALADLSRYALLVFGGWNTMTPHVKDVLERYVEQGGTLVMSRPELTTRVDREYTNYADGDLRPLFGELPAEGDADDFVETVHGKGRYILFTARAFPGASDDGKAAYAAKVRELAAAVRQSATISAATAADRDAICYGVYPEAVYFLNADTVAGHAFTCVLDGEEKSMSLEPLQVAVVDRKTGEIELTLNSWNDAGASDPKPPQEPEPETLSGTRDYDLALESGTRFVAGWNSAVSWDEHRLAASNGTLLVSGTVSTHGYTVDVEDGCRMVFQIGSTLEAASMSGSPFRQVVHDGGELTLNGDMRLYNYRLTVESGGRATVSPTWVETINTTAQGSVFENAGGTMSVPRGLSVSTAASGAGGRVTLRQTSGTLELGGKLVQTAGVEPFALDLAGGLVRIVAPAEVALAMVSVADGVTFAVDLDRFKSGGVFFTSANDELVAKVKGDIAAQLTGTGYLLTEDNGVLTLVAGTPPEDPPEDPDDPEGPPESPPSDDPGGVVTEVTSLKVDSAGRLRIGVKVKMTDDLENPDWQYVTIENPTVSDDGKTLIVPVPASGARGFYKLVAEDPSK